MSTSLPIVVAAIDDTLAALQRLRAELVVLNNRPEQPTRGTIEFEGGSVIELPDDGDHWGRHDDPEET